jgi:serine protease Do
MKMLNKTVRYVLPAVAIGGAVILGGIVWGADHPSGKSPTAHPPPPKLMVNEQPLHRDMLFNTSFAPLVKKVTPSVVKVFTTTKARVASDQTMPPELNRPFFRRFFGEEFQWNTPNGPMRIPPQHGAGSGVIVSKDGYILTHNHVVDNADESVRLTEHRKTRITLVKLWSEGGAHYVVVDESKEKAG